MVRSAWLITLVTLAACNSGLEDLPMPAGSHDLWACLNCSCDNWVSPHEAWPALPRGVVDCVAADIDPASSDAADQACAAVCPGLAPTLGGECGAPTTTPRAHSLASRICELPSSSYGGDPWRQGTAADYHVTLDTSSRLQLFTDTSCTHELLSADASGELTFLGPASGLARDFVRVGYVQVTLRGLSDWHDATLAWIHPTSSPLDATGDLVFPPSQYQAFVVRGRRAGVVQGFNFRTSQITGSFLPGNRTFSVVAKHLISRGMCANLFLTGHIDGEPPVAVAGADVTVPCTDSTGADVTLDASASYDPDPGGSIAYTDWSREDPSTATTDGEDIPIGNTAVVQAHAPVGSTLYLVDVYDEDLTMSSDSTTVTVTCP